MEPATRIKIIIGLSILAFGILIFIAIDSQLKTRSNQADNFAEGPDAPQQQNQTQQIGTGDTAVVVLPATAEVSVGTVESVRMTIQTDDPAKKISGLDLVLVAKGGATIEDIKAVDLVGFQEIKREASAANMRVVFVSFNPKETLPSKIDLDILVGGRNSGPGSISLSRNESQIVGTVAGDAFKIEGDEVQIQIR